MGNAQDVTILDDIERLFRPRERESALARLVTHGAAAVGPLCDTIEKACGEQPTLAVLLIALRSPDKQLAARAKTALAQMDRAAAQAKAETKR